MQNRIRIFYLVLFVMCLQLHVELQQPGLEERDADEETGERGGRGSQRAVRMIIMIMMETIISKRMRMMIMTMMRIRPWRVLATRPDPNFFLLPEPDPNFFSKSPSIGFFPAGCFPADCFKPFTIILKFCCFLVVPTWNPLFLNQNVLDTRYESKESQGNLTIDLWCILISSWGNQINQSKRS